MQTYDIIMLVVLVGATLYGAFKGFAWQIASLASMVLSYLVAYRFRDQLTPHIDAAPPWNMFGAMLLLYAGTSVAIWLAFRLVAGAIDKMKMKGLDRQFGALFGFAKGAIACSLITLFAVTLLGDASRRDIIQSKSGRRIAQLLHDSDRIMPSELKTVLDPYLQDFDRKVDDIEDGDVPSDPDAASSDRSSGIVGPIRGILDQSGAGGNRGDSSDSPIDRIQDSIERGVQRGVEQSVDRAFDAARRRIGDPNR